MLVESVDHGRQFLTNATRLVNGLENVVDDAWRQARQHVERHTSKAHSQMRLLIASLPPHPRKDMADVGYVDNVTHHGRAKMLAFRRAMAKIYNTWHQGIRRDLGLPQPSKRSWEISLGHLPHRGSRYLMRLRDEVVRKGHQLATLLDQVPVSEARERVVKTTGGVKSARITGRGLPAGATSHSRTTSIILRGLKGVIEDQEKAMLENVLRGIDQLPRNHANKLYDATTGLTLRDALNAVADEFSVGEMDQRQLKLSIQTHIRAMMRRIAGAAHEAGDVTDVEDYVMVPPTRRLDITRAKRGRGSQSLAFTTMTGPELLRTTKGSGDSLGRYAGDQLQPVPVPKAFFDDVKKAAEIARRSYLRRLGRGKSK